MECKVQIRTARRNASKSYVRVRVRVRFFLIVRVRVKNLIFFPTTKWGDFLKNGGIFCNFSCSISVYL